MRGYQDNPQENSSHIKRSIGANNDDEINHDNADIAVYIAVYVASRGYKHSGRNVTNAISRLSTPSYFGKSSQEPPCSLSCAHPHPTVRDLLQNSATANAYNPLHVQLHGTLRRNQAPVPQEFQQVHHWQLLLQRVSQVAKMRREQCQ